MPLSQKDLAALEMQRRAAVLPGEIKEWLRRTSDNVDGMGIHKSQLVALDDLMADVLDRQTPLWQQLEKTLTPEEHADVILSLTSEVVGAHELWRVFRYILSQRDDPGTREVLDLAHRVAADSYLTCLESARNAKIIGDDRFREPPLVGLEADDSPSTANRGYRVQDLGLPLGVYRATPLPIPIVLLPFDHLSSIWMLCSLYHEVGHNIDQDLKLAEALQTVLVPRLEAQQVPQERWSLWRSWTAEITADAFGIMLGGEGFASALASILLPIVSAVRFSRLQLDDPHPPLHLRVELLAALLAQSGVPSYENAASALVDAARSRPSPAWATPFRSDIDVVAKTIMHDALPVLGGRPITMLVPDQEQTAPRIAALADYLATGFQQPDLTHPSPLGIRVVPAAAQLAVQRSETAGTLDQIHARAMEVAGRIERKTFLAGASRREYFRSLAKGIDFGLGSSKH